MANTRIIKFEPAFNEDEFKRRVLLDFYHDPDTPADISNIQFEEIELCYSTYYGLKAEVEVEYRGSVGYDRKETYTEYEQRFDSETHMDYKEPVTKTRTVTDWRYISDSITYKGMEVKLNKSYKKFEDHLGDENDLEDIKGEKTESYTNFTMPKNIKDEILESLCQHAKNEVVWPGDQHRDEKYSCLYKVLEEIKYETPVYHGYYTYNDKKYYCCISALPEREPYFAHDNVKLEVDDSVIAYEKKHKTKAALWWLISLLALVVAFTLYHFGYFWVGYITPATFIFSMLISDKALASLNSKRNELADAFKENKLLELKKSLELNKLKPITDEEANTYKPSHINNQNAPDSYLDSFLGILSFILMVIALIMSIYGTIYWHLH